MSKNDGGPAFPVRNPVTNEQYAGLSLRDWYAGQALAGLLAAGNDAGLSAPEKLIPVAAYQYADAMLKARGEDT